MVENTQTAISEDLLSRLGMPARLPPAATATVIMTHAIITSVPKKNPIPSSVFTCRQA